MQQRHALFLIFIAFAFPAGWGCRHMPAAALPENVSAPAVAGADRLVVVEAATGRRISLDALADRLADVQVVYVGETHTDPDHHRFQLHLLRALHARRPEVAMGMEMFDRRYQDILNRWSNGTMDFTLFLERVHWYANWRHNAGLYRDILMFIREHRLPLIGLNLPFHIPSKIATGGIDSLLEEDRGHLPLHIDTTNAGHRRFVENVFRHHQLPGRERFDYFYAAQCAWDEVMAETIARNVHLRPMIVLAGRGHIEYRFGIPERAFRRTGETYRTILPGRPDSPASPDKADYFFFPASYGNGCSEDGA